MCAASPPSARGKMVAKGAKRRGPFP
jgi:hypothetical protein